MRLADMADPYEPGRAVWRGLAVAALALALAGACAAQEPARPTESQTAVEKQAIALPIPHGIKLMLKDGTFHVVRSYERKGDRVRFYSVERSAWEELPADWVDWEATKKAETEHARQEVEAAERIKEIKRTVIAADVNVDASIEVAPGVFLPDAPGLYLVEEGGTETLTASAAGLKRDAKRTFLQIFSPIPVVPSLHRVELPGPRAERRIRTPSPEFYIRTEDGREPEFELIRARVKGKKRELERINTAITGQQERRRNSISIQRWEVAKGVYRLTTSETLEPGEYVLAEMVPEKGMDLGVWDFGVDPPGRPAKKEPIPKR